MITLKIFFAAILLALFAAVSAFAQGTDSKLPDSTAGHRVAAYLAAFNSGDEAKMRQFFLQNVPEESLKQRPIETRLDFYRQMRGQMQTISLRKVADAKPEKITIIVQTGTGEWLQFDFMFEPQAPNKLVGIGVDQTQDPAAEADIPAALTRTQFNNFLENYLSKLAAEDEFSGVVLVAKKDQHLFEKAYGLASKEFGVANRVDTKFNLGSINKVITQIAIAQLAAAGKLTYSDKLGKILSDYPNRQAAEKVTVKQLLTMTSGIGDFFGDKFDAISKDSLRSNKDYLPLFASDPLLFEPGSKNQYSNGGYVVLGAIIEKVSGQSYYDYVRQNIFAPAGMTNTDSFSTNDLVSNLAQGYTREGVEGNDKKLRRNNVLSRPARGSAAGGGYSTAEDMLKLSLALQTGKLKSVDVDSPNGQSPKPRSFGFAGGAPGINANVEINVENGFTIVVLSNYDPPSATSVGQRIRSLLSRVTD
jgi:CubicO group peptidase (beta-lactamase class C family)